MFIILFFVYPFPAQKFELCIVYNFKTSPCYLPLSIIANYRSTSLMWSFQVDPNSLWKFSPFRKNQTNKHQQKKMWLSSTAKNLVGKMNSALAISTGFIGLCCLLAAIARMIVSRKVQSCLVKELLFEAIAAAELCACCFELIIGECDRQINK